MTKKVAAFDQIHHILAKLNITDEPRNLGNLNAERWQGNAAPLKTGHQYWPYTFAKPSVQPSADDCIELDTTNPFGSTVDTKPSQATAEPRPGLWTQDANGPSVSLAADELDYTGALESFIRRSASTIAKARRVMELEVAALRELEDNLSFAQRGRQYKEYGETCNSDNASRANAADAQTPDCGNSSNSNLLSTMAQYQSPTDTTLCLSTDPTGTKCCTMSKSQKRTLPPSIGRFYITGRCDRYADQTEFDDIMLGHMGREGQYMASAYAWHCPREPARPQRETIYRG